MADDTTTTTAPPTAWRGPILPLNTESGDGRVYQLDDGADIDVRPLPLPLCAQTEISPGHDGARVIGRLDRVWAEDGHVWGEGTFDSEDAEAMQWARKVRDGYAGWVSADFDRIGYRQVARDADGQEVTAADIARGAVADGTPQTQVHTWRIMGATLVSGPAFAEAKIAAVDAGTPDALTASLTAAGVNYPASHFADPQLPGPTALTVTKGGRVFGHLANWDTCHIGRADRCIRPPRSAGAYRYFHNGLIDTDTGELPVGKLTLGTGHARMGLGAHAAVEHYDNTGAAVAIIRAGEDQHGIWVAGRILPGVSDERVAELRRSGVSGDWRTIRGALELVAALAVNTPGFPVPRAEALVAGAESSLVAAGVVVPGWEAPRCTDEAPELEHAAPPVVQAAEEIVASVAARVAHDENRMRVAALDRRMGAAVAARQGAVAALTSRIRATSASLLERRATRAADTPGGRMPPELHRYWTKGEGAAKWVATPHPFTALVTALEATPDIAADMSPEQIKGLAANLYHDVFGKWPGPDRGDKADAVPDAAALDPSDPPTDPAPAEPTDDAEPEHTGGMVALIPAASDAADLALDGAEPPDELHVTLAYLGDDLTDVADDQVDEWVRIITEGVAQAQPLSGTLFARASFNDQNPDREQCAVYLIEAPGLSALRAQVWDIAEAPPIEAPAPTFDGYVPHMTMGYGVDVGDLAAGQGREVTFDRIRVAVAGRTVDIPLGTPPPSSDDVEEHTVSDVPAEPVAVAAGVS
ncbi:2'-5' RNA ligase family protein [Williamsia herbipolensis]|uniref:2'-5' RNA ligase family protein n=1 Tax=Williamsia herbipolensis TaxID=1603258 RepID=A0AAU4K085_9NOCA|nr:2'-5' RNA ligase family protein [Williamsia herbipolensis]